MIIIIIRIGLKNEDAGSLEISLSGASYFLGRLITHVEKNNRLISINDWKML
jgi:hypothetical protein